MSRQTFHAFRHDVCEAFHTKQTQSKISMKKYAPIMAIAVCLTVCFCFAALSKAQEKPVPAARYEYGMIKWDGPDYVQFVTPQKTETVRVFKSGGKLPAGIHDEEYCVVWAANHMAKDGWEVVTLHATRVMMRRAL